MNISKFNKALFWDVNPETLDLIKHAKFIIGRVLQYGSFDDWKTLKEFYSIDKIVSEAKTIKDLDKKTASFLSIISTVPKEDFICYSTKQLTPKHWNY